MSFSAKSLFSQKKGTIYGFVLLAAVALVLVGVLSVTGNPGPYTRSITLTPEWNTPSFNSTYNFTISNSAGNTAIDRIEVTKPSGYSDIFCGATVPSGWTCSKLASDLLRFTTGTIAAGASESFYVNSTSSGSAGGHLFTVETKAGTDLNTTTHTTSVDTLPPKLDLMNVSDGTRILNSGGHLDGTLFLSNSTGRIDFIFNATDNESSVNLVTLYYNISNSSVQLIKAPDHRNASTNFSTLTLSNGSMGPGSLFNATLMGNNTLNGSRIIFQVVANDTVRNGNVSNYTSISSDRVYNFTIDAAAPRFEDVQILNASQLTTNTLGEAINTTKTFGSLAGLEYIINSSLLLNVSALVSDGGGSGVVRVQVMNRSGNFTDMGLVTGTNNGSSNQTIWNLTADARNITDLAQRVGGFNGDGLYNLSFRITDNVSNVVNNNFTVEVDDTPPTGFVTTNITINGNLSEGNVTLDLNTLNVSGFNINLTTSSNINNVTRNVSVFGNKGLVFNLTYLSGSGTPSGTSTWNLTVQNATLNNLSNFCDASTGFTAADGSQCNLRFNFSDVLGRMNSTINLTIAVDAAVPNVSIISPVLNQTTNYSTTVLINASVNDSVGPLRNVSFRWVNSSAGAILEGANVSNWMPLSLTTGTNSQFNASGYWTATFTISGLVDSNYSIQINATDSGARQNATVNVTNVIFDSSKPQNISILTPSTNSFHRVNFTVNINATERVSGLLNVSVRLENATFNSSWVAMNQTISALSSVTDGGITVKYNATNFNLTHVGSGASSIPLNASNGNFTLRLNVTDTAGNQNTTVTINFTIDTVPPSSVTIVAPANGLNQSANFTVNVSATESNVNTVQYRWENGSEVATNEGQNFSNWINMNNIGGANNWNGTFNITHGTPLDGNYTLRVNVTDKAGWNITTTYIQLVIDRTVPVVQLVGAAGNSITSDRVINTSFLINVTVNDTGTWNMPLGKITTTNINASSVRLINTSGSRSTGNSAYQNFQMPTTSAGGNYSNATFTFSDVANGVFDINITINDTAGNVNYTIIANVTLDNTAPSVRTINTTPVASGGAGLSGAIVINATVTDNLGYGANGIDNVSVNVTFINSAGAIVNSTRMTTGSPASTERWNVTIATTSIADGDYFVYVNATDRAGNVNSTQFISITVQNGITNPLVRNLTFQGGTLTESEGFGIYTNLTSPTWLLNTTENATCKYSKTGNAYWDDLLPQTTGNTMNNNVSRQHNEPLGFLPDRAADGYSIYYVCQDVSQKSFPTVNNYTTEFKFSVDTRNRFNITLGATGSNKARGDYLATGWNGFAMPKTTLLANTGVPTNYNVSNVLGSLANSAWSVWNFTRIFAYNGTAWASYITDSDANTFTNFTSDSPEKIYYINVSVANERLEIN